MVAWQYSVVTSAYISHVLVLLPILASACSCAVRLASGTSISYLLSSGLSERTLNYQLPRILKIIPVRTYNKTEMEKILIVGYFS